MYLPRHQLRRQGCSRRLDLPYSWGRTSSLASPKQFLVQAQSCPLVTKATPATQSFWGRSLPLTPSSLYSPLIPPVTRRICRLFNRGLHTTRRCALILVEVLHR